MKTTTLTTLNKIMACSLCLDSWEKLLKGLNKTQADNEPLAFKTILEICGLDDALWATRAAPEYNKDWRLLAVALARRVQHLNPDPRVAECLNVAERYANGQATDEELREARDAARTTADTVKCFTVDTVCFTVDAAWAAAWAADEPASFACGVSWVAKAAALAAEKAAKAAGEPARVAWDAERKEQEKLFIEFISQ